MWISSKEGKLKLFPIVSTVLIMCVCVVLVWFHALLQHIRHGSWIYLLKAMKHHWNKGLEDLVTSNPFCIFQVNDCVLHCVCGRVVCTVWWEITQTGIGLDRWPAPNASFKWMIFSWQMGWRRRLCQCNPRGWVRSYICFCCPPKYLWLTQALRMNTQKEPFLKHSLITNRIYLFIVWIWTKDICIYAGRLRCTSIGFLQKDDKVQIRQQRGGNFL